MTFRGHESLSGAGDCAEIEGDVRRIKSAKISGLNDQNSGSGAVTHLKVPESFRRLFSKLDYPVWLETAAGDYLLLKEGECSLRLEAASGMTDAEQDEIGAAVSKGWPVFRPYEADDARISVAVYPLELGRQRWGERAVRLMVACRPGQEMQRDRAVVSALCRGLWLLGDEPVPVEDGLSPQLRQVYRLLCSGLSYKEVAATLGVAHSTVRVQVAALRKRLGEKRVPVLRRAVSKPI